MLATLAMQWDINAYFGSHICAGAYDSMIICSSQSIYLVIVVVNNFTCGVYIYIQLIALPLSFAMKLGYVATQVPKVHINILQCIHYTYMQCIIQYIQYICLMYATYTLNIYSEIY